MEKMIFFLINIFYIITVVYTFFFNKKKHSISLGKYYIQSYTYGS